MKKKLVVAILLGYFCVPLCAQNTVKGVVLDDITEAPLSQVLVSIQNVNYSFETDNSGAFALRLKDGRFLIEFSLKGYHVQKYPVNMNGKSIDLGLIYLSKDEKEEEDVSTITITDDELNSDDGFIDNIAGLLQASRDAFFRAAAFDFSATFFRPRGFDNANGKVLINGIEMNKLSNGRPQWANWGGMNDLQRNQVFTPGITPNDLTFGDIAGVNSISMRASQYSKGTRISYAFANRSYRGRVMASYSSGILHSGWSFSFLASRRFGNEGFVEGTLYDSHSFFASIEKKINRNHSLNLSLIYAQNRGGRSTALTKEVFQLKKRSYNPLWGNFKGERKNTRERFIEEPILMLNHFWNISKKSSVQTNIAFQTGYIGNTRIDNGGTDLIISPDGNQYYSGGARNPDPTYYQNLPSFFLNKENPTIYDYQQAYLAQEKFENNGQFDWYQMIEANQIQSNLGNNAVYVLQEDRMDDNQFHISSIFYSELTENIKINASISHRNLFNESYAKIKNTLGGTGFLDVDFFAEETLTSLDGEILSNLAQSDVKNPNRIVKKGERYKYNYEIKALVTDAFVQAQFNYSKTDYYLGVNFSTTTYQRNGLFENGHFQGGQSFGKSDNLSFKNLGIKGGLTYKLSGQHLFNLNAAYLTKAPTIQNSFENPRQNNFVVKDIQNERIQTFDTSYWFRHSMVQARITGYYTLLQNITDINFFFTESGNTFNQEIITRIGKQNIGGELGLSAQMTPNIRLKAVAAIGQFTFNNNPNIYYTSDGFLANISGNRRRTYGDGKTYLKNLRVAGGPQKVFQLGFEYRDPDYWWFGMTTNYFSDIYTDVSALKRTEAFSTDFDLIPKSILNQGGNISGYSINNYNASIARKLLQQEKFEPFTLVNIVGGKSWRIGKYSVGLFATVNNIFNQEFRTGGFEQSRRIGYRNQIQEQSNPNGPVFGNRYFYGNGTTYFVNLSIRF